MRGTELDIDPARLIQAIAIERDRGAVASLFRQFAPRVEAYLLRLGVDASQPINYITSQAPPMLLLAGRDDTILDPGNTLRLAAKLRGAGVSEQSGLYPRIGHATLIGAFAWPLGFLAPARQDTVDFVPAHGRCGN